MKRIVSSLLACLMMALTVSVKAETDYAFLNSLTTEELASMQQAISCRLVPAESGTVIYDQEGLSICWLGVVDASYYDYRLGLIITNTSGKTMYFRLEGIALNGIQVGPYQNIMIQEIQDGWGYMSASQDIWPIKKEHLRLLPFDHITTVGLSIGLYESNDSYGPHETITHTFPVNFNLSDLPRW